MIRNNTLPEIKKFKHEQHFYNHLTKLLTILYPKAKIKERIIAFQQDKYLGIVISLKPTNLHVELSDAFKCKNNTFSNSGDINFEELNAIYKWKGNSGYGYLYPRDRDMFEDSELGMEQKACYFIVVIQVLLKFLKPE
jgi:hypothetical protein